MRICDRCQAPAHGIIIFTNGDQKIDICRKCEEDILQFMTAPRQPVEPVIDEADSIIQEPGIHQTDERKRRGRPKR